MENKGRALSRYKGSAGRSQAGWLITSAQQIPHISSTYSARWIFSVTDSRHESVQNPRRLVKGILFLVYILMLLSALVLKLHRANIYSAVEAQGHLDNSDTLGACSSHANTYNHLILADWRGGSSALEERVFIPSATEPTWDNGARCFT